MGRVLRQPNVSIKPNVSLAAWGVVLDRDHKGPIRIDERLFQSKLIVFEEHIPNHNITT